ncbi:MAG: hypothetical protein MdMp014T_1593 [Treponematales bacterium]
MKNISSTKAFGIAIGLLAIAVCSGCMTTIGYTDRKPTSLAIQLQELPGHTLEDAVKVWGSPTLVVDAGGGLTLAKWDESYVTHDTKRVYGDRTSYQDVVVDNFHELWRAVTIGRNGLIISADQRGYMMYTGGEPIKKLNWVKTGFAAVMTAACSFLPFIPVVLAFTGYF